MSSWIERRARSFGHAFRGIRFVARHERNGKYHLAHIVLCVLAFPLVGPLPVSLALIAFGCECFNTAIERAVDIAVEGERRKLAKISKDAASAAVLCCLAACGVADVWCLCRGLAGAW